MVQFMETSAAGGGIGLILSMVVLVVFMYLIIYLPQKRQDKKDTAMRNSIEIGDEVTTIGGVIGRVTAIKEDTFVLETGSDRVKIRFRRSAIASVEKLDMGTGKDSKDAKDSAKSNFRHTQTPLCIGFYHARGRFLWKIQAETVCRGAREKSRHPAAEIAVCRAAGVFIRHWCGAAFAGGRRGGLCRAASAGGRSPPGRLSDRGRWRGGVRRSAGCGDRPAAAAVRAWLRRILCGLPGCGQCRKRGLALTDANIALLCVLVFSGMFGGVLTALRSAPRAG